MVVGAVGGALFNLDDCKEAFKYLVDAADTIQEAATAADGDAQCPGSGTFVRSPEVGVCRRVLAWERSGLPAVRQLPDLLNTVAAPHCPLAGVHSAVRGAAPLPGLRGQRVRGGLLLRLRHGLQRRRRHRRRHLLRHRHRHRVLGGRSGAKRWVGSSQGFALMSGAPPLCICVHSQGTDGAPAVCCCHSQMKLRPWCLPRALAPAARPATFTTCARHGPTRQALTAP